MGAKNLDVVITVIAVILVVLVWIMLYDSNRFVVRHYSCGIRESKSLLRQWFWRICTIRDTEKKMTPAAGH